MIESVSSSSTSVPMSVSSGDLFRPMKLPILTRQGEGEGEGAGFATSSADIYGVRTRGQPGESERYPGNEAVDVDVGRHRIRMVERTSMSLSQSIDDSGRCTCTFSEWALISSLFAIARSLLTNNYHDLNRSGLYPYCTPCFP